MRLWGILTYMPQKASFILKKLLDSAIANAKQKKYVDIDNLYVKNVTGGWWTDDEKVSSEGYGKGNKDTKKNEPHHPDIR